MRVKILNLYAGIGGNRKLWENNEVTAVELDKTIAGIYKDFFPNDTVIIGDAHAYLLEHFREYDFIWSSPPCPTHSRFNNINYKTAKYPDMTLYQEIIYLKHFFEGKYCVENVISYYDPLIIPTESNSHYFWTNFKIPKHPNVHRGIRRQEGKHSKKMVSFDLTKYNLHRDMETQLLNNCVEPEIALDILNCAIGALPPIQDGLFAQKISA